MKYINMFEKNIFIIKRTKIIKIDDLKTLTLNTEIILIEWPNNIK
jgi:hypothetical protein